MYFLVYKDVLLIFICSDMINRLMIRLENLAQNGYLAIWCKLI